MGFISKVIFPIKDGAMPLNAAGRGEGVAEGADALRRHTPEHGAAGVAPFKLGGLSPAHLARTPILGR